jgi:CRP/FNR family cyclic AMP-dependent transcriptional regulator
VTRLPDALGDLAAELGRISIFSDLPPSVLEDLARHVFVRRLARGQVLFTEGEPSDYLFVVRSGRLRVVVRSPRGEELVLTVLGAGDALGELSVLDQHPRSAGAEALEATELIAVPAHDVRALLVANPPALMAVALELAAGMRRLTGDTADLVFLDLGRRLAKYLLAESVSRPDGTTACELPMSQAGIAARMGATRQSLNRALGEFARRNWITIDGTSVLLRDVAALRRFAES